MIHRTILVAVLSTLLSCGEAAPDQQKAPPKEDPKPAGEKVSGGSTAGGWRDLAQAAMAKGVAYLKSQEEEGLFGYEKGSPDLGLTALVTLARLKAPGNRAEDVRTALDWMAGQQKEDGSIHQGSVKTYVTAAAVLAMEASGDSKYRPIVQKALEFLRVVQLDEGEGIHESSETYGGVGYGGSGTTNMSTTQWALDAASAAGLAKDDKFYAKALKFLERSQNRSESNDKTYVVEGKTIHPGNDGGGLYSPGSSKAGIEAQANGQQVFRSYGSMTYALLKSYLLCDLDPRDARVRAALTWISKHWELEYNPGMEHLEEPDAKSMGLYYYYLTIARCLAVAEQRKTDLATLGLGEWREKLARELIERQREDGSWKNDQPRWYEGKSPLVTAYTLIGLAECVGAGG